MKNKTINFLIILSFLMSFVFLPFKQKEHKEKEKIRIISIQQSSKKVKYYKEVNGERIHIDKLTLEKLMKQYDVRLEEVEK